jgi:hypothetical protein
MTSRWVGPAEAAKWWGGEGARGPSDLTPVRRALLELAHGPGDGKSALYSTQIMEELIELVLVNRQLGSTEPEADVLRARGYCWPRTNPAVHYPRSDAGWP